MDKLLWTILFLGVLVASACGVLERLSGHAGLPTWVFVLGDVGLLLLGAAWIYLSPRLKGKFNKVLGSLAILTAVVFGILMIAPFPDGGMGMRFFYLLNLGLLFLTIFWWKLAVLFEGTYNKVISYLGRGAVIPALILYTYFNSFAAMSYFKEIEYKEKMSLENFKETLIEWPGFESPVGLHLEMDLVHPNNMTGAFEQPLFLWLGEFETRLYWGILEQFSQYFSGENSLRPFPVTKHLQFMKAKRTRYDVNRVMNTNARTHLAYDIFPKNLKHFEKNGEKLCFDRDTSKPTDSGNLPEYYQGENLSALWHFKGRIVRTGSPRGISLIIDMSDKVTEELREKSLFQGKQQDWKTMQKQIEFAELRAKGYSECVVMQPKAIGSSSNHKYPFKNPCFCKAPKESSK